MTPINTFGLSSIEQLATCDPRLQKIANEALKYCDFKVICGYRNEEAQQAAFAAGTSKLQFPNSKHNTNPSLAMDLYPYSKAFGTLVEIDSVKAIIAKRTGLSLISTIDDAKINAFIREEFCRLAMVVQVIAQQQGVNIRWGGDWDGDGDRLEKDFYDLPHFEIAE